MSSCLQSRQVAAMPRCTGADGHAAELDAALQCVATHLSTPEYEKLIALWGVDMEALRVPVPDVTSALLLPEPGQAAELRALQRQLIKLHCECEQLQVRHWTCMPP